MSMAGRRGKSASIIASLGPAARRTAELALLTGGEQARLLAVKKATARPPLEEDIHRQVAAWLDLCLAPEVVWFHPANGERRGKAAAGKLKAMGVKPGIPDLLFIHAQQTWAIELKRPGEYPSPVQRDVHERMRAAGAMVAVAHSLDEVRAQLAAWGIPTLGRAPCAG